MAQKFRVRQARIKSEFSNRSGLVTENMTSATADKVVGTTFKNILVDENGEFVVGPESQSICDLDTITQAQADTLTLEDVKVVVCGTGDTNIDGKTTTLDMISGLLNPITAPVLIPGISTAINITTTSVDLDTTDVFADGGSTITSNGWVVYPSGSDETDPLAITQIGSNPLTFTGLTSGTSYCAKPFATNVIGTSYGDEVCFITAFPSTNFIYTTERFLGQVRKYDKDTYSLVSTISVGTNPYSIVYNNLSGFIYVACTGSNRIDIINEMGVVVGNIPLTGASRLYLSNNILFAKGTTSLIRYDILTNTITHTTALSGGGPKTRGDNGSILYIGTETPGGTVYKFNKSDLSSAGTVSTGVLTVSSVNFDSLGNRYVSGYSNGITQKYNSSDVLIWSANDGDTNQACRISPDGLYLYNPRSTPNLFQKINTSDGSIVANVSTNPIPVGTYLYPDGSKLIVCFNSGGFQVFDTNTLALLGTGLGNFTPYAIYTY